jgi:hypothetical protein
MTMADAARSKTIVSAAVIKTFQKDNRRILDEWRLISFLRTEHFIELFELHLIVIDLVPVFRLGHFTAGIEAHKVSL